MQVLSRDLNSELALITVARPFFQGLAPLSCAMLGFIYRCKFFSAGQFSDAKIVLFEKLRQCFKLTVYLDYLKKIPVHYYYYYWYLWSQALKPIVALRQVM